MSSEVHSEIVYLERMSRELADIRKMLTTVVSAIRDAESEIPEKMRRFANYYHDIVHIKGEYVSLGLKAPEHVDREMERCDDRFRQLLEALHLDDGVFAKVRREMAEDPNNKWDHTKQLAAPKEKIE